LAFLSVSLATEGKVGCTFELANPLVPIAVPLIACHFPIGSHFEHELVTKYVLVVFASQTKTVRGSSF
jgi:hypothetical protein